MPEMLAFPALVGCERRMRSIVRSVSTHLLFALTLAPGNIAPNTIIKPICGWL
jgi:hypothetical protein